MPDLNKGRRLHSSAAFNSNTVYVFCGYDGKKSINSIERWGVGEDKWTTIETNGDTLKEKYYHKSVQVDDKFILVFGGAGDKTSFKFFPGTNEVKKADDMSKNCYMSSTPEPFYDKHTKAIYVCDYELKDDIDIVYNIHKFDQDQKWSIAVEDIKKNPICFE